MFATTNKQKPAPDKPQWETSCLCGGMLTGQLELTLPVPVWTHTVSYEAGNLKKNQERSDIAPPNKLRSCQKRCYHSHSWFWATWGRWGIKRTLINVMRFIIVAVWTSRPTFTLLLIRWPSLVAESDVYLLYVISEFQYPDKGLRLTNVWL